jgi:hypothetical protein
MKHIQQEAIKMVQDWEDNGFEGVDFVQCHACPQSREENEQTQEEFDKWVENYVVFIAQPDLFVDEPANRFISHEADLFGFQEALNKEIKRRLGDDITIRYSEGCFEYEVERSQ